MQETMNKINESFSKHQHLRMAVAALALLGEDKLLEAGDVKGFEEWVCAHPATHNNLGNCRHFLQALCPVRYNHACKSRNWENVAARFPVAAQLLVECSQAANKAPICLDFAPQARLGFSKPGKRARAAMEIASKVLSAYADEAGYKLVGVEGRNPDKVPMFSFTPHLSVSKTYSLQATTDQAMHAAQELAELLEKAGRNIALTEDSGERVDSMGGAMEVVVSYPVHPTDYDEQEMKKELEFLAYLIYKGGKHAVLTSSWRDPSR